MFFLSGSMTRSWKKMMRNDIDCDSESLVSFGDIPALIMVEYCMYSPGNWDWGAQLCCALFSKQEPKAGGFREVQGDVSFHYKSPNNNFQGNPNIKIDPSIENNCFRFVNFLQRSITLSLKKKCSGVHWWQFPSVMSFKSYCSQMKILYLHDQWKTLFWGRLFEFSIRHVEKHNWAWDNSIFPISLPGYLSISHLLSKNNTVRSFPGQGLRLEVSITTLRRGNWKWNRLLLSCKHLKQKHSLN